MIEWIVTSGVLIGIVIGLRLLTKGKISMQLRYGLWILVLVRLLIPVSIPSSLSIMNLLPEPVVSEQPTIQAVPQLPVFTTPDPLPSLPAVQLQPQHELQPQHQPVTQKTERSVTPISWEQVLSGIWIAGMVVTGCILLFTNVHFALKLRRSRSRIHIPGCKVPVYQSAVLSTPCVHGLLFPKIYLTAENMDDAQIQHILIHEMTHLRHGDPLWSLLRCVCLVLHWYNPLVWIAALLSRQDAELACDEAAIHSLGEAQRSAYGQTLIRISCTKNAGKGLLVAASTMHTTKKLLKERILMIAKKPRNTILALLLFILVAVIAIGCTMTGSKQNTPSGDDAASSQTITFQAEDITYIRHNGGFGSDFFIRLNKDGTFTYSEGSLSSFYGYGNWTMEDGILTIADEKFTNRFRVEAGELVWLAKNSSGFMYGPLISLADGDRFISQAGLPEQLTHIAELSFLPQDYMDGGPMGCFVHVDGTTYVWDHKAIGSLYGLPIEEVGAVKTCDNTAIPTTELAACRIPKGTVLYKGRDAGNSKYEAIYYKLEGHPLYARLLPMEAYRGAERWWDNQATHDGKEKLTVDALRELSEEHGKLLSRAHLTQYSYLQFNALDSFDYRLFQVDTDYRLLLISAATVADIEAQQARFYHKDSPNYWVDLMTTDIDFYQSNLTYNEVENIAKTELVYETEGFVTAESLKSGIPCLVQLKKNCEGNLHLDTQLVINSSAGTIHEVITYAATAVIPEGENLYLADLDGDSVCEIILQEDCGGNGGHGAYRCRVFKVDNNTLTEIFEVEPERDMDTGFYWEICDQFTFRIHNRITGDSWELKADEYRKAYYFDEAGISTVDASNHQLWVDSFYEFHPKDVDGDGIYELCTTQYAWDITHVDGVGDAKCIFKYDKASNRFRIIEADFIPYTE